MMDTVGTIIHVDMVHDAGGVSLSWVQCAQMNLVKSEHRKVIGHLVQYDRQNLKMAEEISQ